MVENTGKTRSGERRLIGSIIPLSKISKSGVAEKSRANGRINNLHRWWATRPTTVSRITAYSSLVYPPLSDHEDVINDMCDYARSTNPYRPEIRERARHHIKKDWNRAPKILDPFGGSGALPFAAGWLGCESHSMDYNPVAVLIQKCALEYPAKYGKRLIDDVKNTADRMEAQIHEAVRKFYPDGRLDNGPHEPYGYRWCKTVLCRCGTIIPLAQSYVLSNNRDICLYPKMDKNNIIFHLAGAQYGNIPDGFDPKKGQMKNNIAKCVACGHTYTNLEIRRMFNEGRGDEQMMVAVYTHPKKPGRFYVEIDADDHTLYEKCKGELEKRRVAFKDKYKTDPLPYDIISTPDKKEYQKGGSYWDSSRVVAHGYTRWEDLFNTRQLLCMVCILEIFRQTEDLLSKEYGDEYGVVVLSYMALVMDKTIEKYCRLSPWLESREGATHCFARQALVNVWDYAEAEPSILWQKSSKSVLEGLAAALSAAEQSRYHVQMGSATNLPYPDGYFDAVCTDPPYYDSMQYSKTADFFYVWLKKALGHLPVYQNLFRGVLSPKKEEVVETSGDATNYSGTSDIVRDSDGYQCLMTKSIQEMYRVLRHDGILVLVYAHKTTQGWETLIQSMLDSGFVITAAWPIDTEGKTRMNAQGTASLASSIYMVGRKWSKSQKRYYRDVWEELRAHLCGKMDYFMEQGISGADFYIAAIGASCEVYGKYESVIRDDTGEPITIREMLADIRGLCSDHIVKMLTTGTAGEIDSISRLYISWRWAYGDRAVQYDEARKMFTGVGLDIGDYTSTIIKKTGQAVSMLDSVHREDEKIRPKNTIDVIHKALQLWRNQETSEMRELLASTGNRNNPRFEKICQAIIEAGAAKPGVHLETNEKRTLEAFLAGRRSESTDNRGTNLDAYV